MCGITGSVGRPKDPILAYNLHTHLLIETQKRGHHATGFYAVNLDGEAMFDKAPVSAEAYIKRPEWKQLIHGNIAMIGHARFTTQGRESSNINNHPHVNRHGNMALVHNGMIYNYFTLKHKYDLVSECDSEIILRIIEKEKNVVSGIKKVYEIISPRGDFACELIHTNNNKTMFYFFRDKRRPAIMVDAREVLGQIIFCSEASIWINAVMKSNMPKEIKNLKAYNVPENKILIVNANTVNLKEVDVNCYVGHDILSNPYIMRL